ncbi:MAG TPA: gamma-type small acid-soluble spore protein [Bacillus sp. (in: firmicutes)]|uniref:gamma-type small acid-soluble spore protein n=1 Tax=Bacillus litorisediminis TaxID=2922713 RepID=UPI001FADFEB5|nr:gamma-type small acid-soluble spore protein [Bacillus litorisediminis]HWO77343.1 gamma-type small acid-soluble spore protein [Bacillus sp. (in: firmicutes)]
MKENNSQEYEHFTIVGTNINEVKRKIANSGMSYNEVKEWLAKTTGGHGTSIYSDTDVEQVKRKNQGLK